MTARPLLLAPALALSLALLLAPAPRAAQAQDGVDSVAATDRADVLVLKDGRRLVGQVVGESDRVVSFRADGVTRSYTRDRVQSLEKGAVEAPRADEPTSDTPTTGTDKPQDKDAKQATQRAARAARKAGAPLSEPARAWLDTLIAQSAAADPQVQRSLAAAMHALGPAAVTPLREAAASADGGTRLFLDRVARSIEENAKRKRRTSDVPTDRADMRAQAARRMRATLGEELSITPDQRPEFGAALDAAQARQGEIGAALRGGSIDKAAAREQLASVRADLLGRMKGVLDEAQFALYEQISAEYFAKLAKKMKPGKTPQ